MKKIIILITILFGTNYLYANKTSIQLNKEFQEMLYSLEQSCSKYQEYYPYETAQEDIQKYKKVENFKDYDYAIIFGSDFLKFNNIDDCRPVAIDFIINGIQWATSNKLINPSDAFFDSIYRNYARALVYKFYLTGREEFVDNAIDILNKYYLEHYTLEEYNALSRDKKLTKSNLKKSITNNNFKYYNPTSYYLATMTLVPETFDIPSDILETLLIKTQKFEKTLLGISGKTFSNYESATFNIFYRLLYSYKDNKYNYDISSQKLKEHLMFSKKNNYISYNYCQYISKIYNNLKTMKTDYKKPLIKWLNDFNEENCKSYKTIKKIKWIKYL